MLGFDSGDLPALVEPPDNGRNAAAREMRSGRLDVRKAAGPVHEFVGGHFDGSHLISRWDTRIPKQREQERSRVEGITGTILQTILRALNAAPRRDKLD